MWEHQQIVTSDPFTYTVFGRSWIDHEWLFQILLFQVHTLAGTAGVLFFKAGLIFLIALGFYHGLPRTAPTVVRVLSLPFTFYLVRFRNMVRPDLMALVIFVWMMASFLKILDENPSQRWRVAGVLLGMLLWVNIHASFWFMVGLCALCALIWEREKKGQNIFSGLLLGFLVIILMNPYGWRLPLQTLRSSWQLLGVDRADFLEYAATPWRGRVAYWSLVIVTVACAIVRSIQEKRWPASRWLLLLAAVWIGQAFHRNVPFSIFLLVPILLRTLFRPGKSSWTKWKTVRGLPHALIAGSMICLVLAIASARIGVDERLVPRQVAELLRTQFRSGRLYNDYNLGSYLIWALYEERRPIFIDGRLHAIEGYPQLWRELKAARELDPDALAKWRALERRWGFTVAAVEIPPIHYAYRGRPFSPFDYYFPVKEWAQVHADTRFALYAKRSAYPAALIKAYEQRPASPAPALPPWPDLFNKGSDTMPLSR